MSPSIKICNYELWLSLGLQLSLLLPREKIPIGTNRKTKRIIMSRFAKEYTVHGGPFPNTNCGLNLGKETTSQEEGRNLSTLTPSSSGSSSSRMLQPAGAGFPSCKSSEASLESLNPFSITAGRMPLANPSVIRVTRSKSLASPKKYFQDDVSLQHLQVPTASYTFPASSQATKMAKVIGKYPAPWTCSKMTQRTAVASLKWRQEATASLPAMLGTLLLAQDPFPCPTLVWQNC